MPQHTNIQQYIQYSHIPHYTFAQPTTEIHTFFNINPHHTAKETHTFGNKNPHNAYAEEELLRTLIIILAQIQGLFLNWKQKTHIRG
jgi:hypothetical protein